MLIGGANRVAVGVKAVVGDHQAFPGGGILRVKRIGILKPGTRVSQIQVDGIAGRDLVVHAVEQVFLISLGVYHGELGWIEETTAIECVGRNEIAPLVAAVGEVDADIGGPERTVRSSHSSGWLLYPCPERVVRLMTRLAFSPYSAGGAPEMTSMDCTASKGIWLEKV